MTDLYPSYPRVQLGSVIKFLGACGVKDIDDNIIPEYSHGIVTNIESFGAGEIRHCIDVILDDGTQHQVALDENPECYWMDGIQVVEQ